MKADQIDDIVQRIGRISHDVYTESLSVKDKDAKAWLREFDAALVHATVAARNAQTRMRDIENKSSEKQP